ncbi:hypothetical protein DFJ73DRAFT_382756 [Zopfochytrium polystomum]|nr:hypothetical protein DFJ73DRAFT_382756 [Zopfochytrium polystomum]
MPSSLLTTSLSAATAAAHSLSSSSGSGSNDEYCFQIENLRSRRVSDSARTSPSPQQPVFHSRRHSISRTGLQQTTSSSFVLSPPSSLFFPSAYGSLWPRQETHSERLVGRNQSGNRSASPGLHPFASSYTLPFVDSFRHFTESSLAIGQSPSLVPSTPSRPMPRSLFQPVMRMTAGQSSTSSRSARYGSPTEGSSDTATSPSSGVPADLPIVRGIQTSKLRVDESRLTHEYFQLITREAVALCDTVRVRDPEQAQQRQRVAMVAEAVNIVFPDSEVGIVGGAACGVAVAGAELDVCASLSDDAKRLGVAHCIERIGQALKDGKMKDLRVLSRSRVPAVTPPFVPYIALRSCGGFFSCFAHRSTSPDLLGR